MLNIFSVMILLLVLLPVIGGCLVNRRFSKTFEVFASLLVFTSQLLMVVALDYFLRKNATRADFLDWNVLSPVSLIGRGLFDQLSWQFQLEYGPVLFLLPILFLTSCLLKPSRISGSLAGQYFLLAGANLIVIANDVASLMGGAMLTSLALISLGIRTSSNLSEAKSSETSMTIIGWSAIFTGVAWLMACAAIVRAAPHGLPGKSTTNLDDLALLVLRAAEQHPAARFTWQQYQLLPTAAILLGVGLLGGLVPVHGLYARTIEHGSLTVRLWSISLAKIALLLLYRLLIEPDPASWASTAKLLSLPVLCGFVYASYLMAARTTPAMQFSRLIVWSQQFTLLGCVMIPNSGAEILWLCCSVQFAGLVLLALLLEFSKDSSQEKLFIPKLIGVMSIGATSSLAGLLLVWDASLQISTSTRFGAAGFVLFAIALLIALSGLSNFMEGPMSVTQGDSTPLNLRRKSILFCWSCLTILGSLLAPLVIASVH